MGVDAGDVNGDGWPDLFISNITSAFGLHESHFLFVSMARGWTLDTPIAAGLAPMTGIAFVLFTFYLYGA